MRRTLLQWLACPACQGPLNVTAPDGETDLVDSGDLHCQVCARSFPVVSGIPRMFVPFDPEAAPPRERFRVSPSVVERWVDRHVPAARWERDVPAKSHSPDYWRWVRTAYLALAFLLLGVGVNLLIIAAGNLCVACLAAALIIFVADYAWYRLRERLAHQRDLLLLRQMLRAPGQTSGQRHLLTQMKPFHETVPDEAAAGLRLDQLAEEDCRNQRQLVGWKAFKLEQTLPSVPTPGRRVLNIGCGGKLHAPVSRAYLVQGFEMVGLDYRQQHILEFSAELRADGVLGNALCLPFADASFDWVNCTDVIEHVLSPEQLLREAARVLGPDGVLLLTTENRTSLGFFASHPLACYALNPLIFLERVAGTCINSILPPREIVGSWSGVLFYHTQFSPQELASLLHGAGFCLLRQESAFPLVKAEPINRLMARLPFLRWGVKPASPLKQFCQLRNARVHELNKTPELAPLPSLDLAAAISQVAAPDLECLRVVVDPVSILPSVSEHQVVQRQRALEQRPLAQAEGLRGGAGRQPRHAGHFCRRVEKLVLASTRNFASFGPELQKLEFSDIFLLTQHNKLLIISSSIYLRAERPPVVRRKTEAVVIGGGHALDEARRNRHPSLSYLTQIVKKK
jgi:2-polyprenyl-3-methyl-5-hydroxy-6-metoxy-1,4-benzoquinol methylase/uncharacterized protein YbaR (Trm112 family)